MAGVSLHAPGELYGPCVPACRHRDCAESRRMAAEICKHCAKEIGYRRKFYEDSPSVCFKNTLAPWPLVHADCHENACAAKRGVR